MAILVAGFYPHKGSVQINGIIMGIGEITIFNHQLPCRAGRMDTVRKADRNMAGAFPGHEIAIVIINVLTHLDQPAESMHIVDIHMVGSHVFALPDESARRLPDRVGSQLNHRSHLLHHRTLGIIDDPHMGIVNLLQAGNIIEGAVTHIVVSGHLPIRLIRHNAVGILMVSRPRPIILIRVRALFTVPLHRSPYNLVREAFGNQKIGIGLAVLRLAHIRNCHF